MTLFLCSLPVWLSVSLAVVIPTLLAMCCSLYVRHVFGLERLVINNEVAGFKFAVLGVIYAVLLGFAVIVVWEKFRDAEAAVAQEASALVSIHRLAQGWGPEQAGGVRQHLADYVRAVLSDDWAAMAQGKISTPAGRALDGLYAAVLSVDPATPRATVIMSEMLTRLDAVTQARRTRLLLATGIVPGVLWAVLIVGAVFTLGFSLFFGSRSVRAQTTMTGMLAAVIFMALYVAIEIDHPFTGPVSVGPEAMRIALDAFNDAH